LLTTSLQETGKLFPGASPAWSNKIPASAPYFTLKSFPYHTGIYKRSFNPQWNCPFASSSEHALRYCNDAHSSDDIISTIGLHFKTKTVEYETEKSTV
jgi:hypothetical protein